MVLIGVGRSCCFKGDLNHGSHQYERVRLIQETNLLSIDNVTAFDTVIIGAVMSAILKQGEEERYCRILEVEPNTHTRDAYFIRGRTRSLCMDSNGAGENWGIFVEKFPFILEE